MAKDRSQKTLREVFIDKKLQEIKRVLVTSIPPNWPDRDTLIKDSLSHARAGLERSFEDFEKFYTNDGEDISKTTGRPLRRK